MTYPFCRNSARRWLGGCLTVAWLAMSVVAVRAQSTYATPYTFSTLAGSAGVSGNTNGPGAAARFKTPYGVAVDAGGTIYVADTDNHLIRKVTPAGVVSTLAGSGAFGATDGPAASAQFRFPRALTIDSAGTVYVADTNNNSIRKISTGGTVSTLATGFNSPQGVAVDSAGNVFVADSNNFTIRKITPGGAVSVLAGSPGVSGATNGTGSAALFLYPQAMTIDSAGNLYVAEFANHTIRKITPAGVVTTVAGSTNLSGSTDGTGAAARFNNPFGMAADGAGNLFVADSYNNVIRKIAPGAVVTTVAGLARTGGSTNGVGAAARFDSPTGIAVDGAGTLYVVETNNQTLRVGLPPGGGKLPGITVPLLIPAGASAVEARALAEQPGGGVIVAVSGSYAVRPSGGGGARALVTPDYTNPQPYNLSYVVRLLANGQPDPAFTSAPGGDGTVNAVAVQADGKILVGGTFTTFNGVLFRNLARLRADGKSDPTLVVGSGADAQVNAIAVQADGKILVGGAFQNFAGQSRPYLIRVSDTGAIETAFSPGVNGTVDSIAL